MKRIVIVASIVLSIVSVFYIRSAIQEPARQTADMVIFSYNRPLQLYALLESLKKYSSGLNSVHVIYRSDGEFENGYAAVRSNFNSVAYHRQGANPKQDFKQLTLQAAFESPASYIIFAVDDIVLKDQVNFAQMADALEKYNAYGFYLRMGLNLTNCYSWGGATQPLPPLVKHEQDIYSWQFSQGRYDWIYAHTVDMTLYRKKDIESDFRIYSYYSPNKLEDIWNLRSRKIVHKRGLCYTNSKIVNLPLNRVQHEYNNRAMKEWSPKDLLTQFLDGKKMDIQPLYCVNNKSAHMEYMPTFVTR